MSNPARLFYALCGLEEASINEAYFSKAISSNYHKNIDGSKSNSRLDQ
jgi:hypothetical protein